MPTSSQRPFFPATQSESCAQRWSPASTGQPSEVGVTALRSVGQGVRLTRCPSAGPARKMGCHNNHLVKHNLSAMNRRVSTVSAVQLDATFAALADPTRRAILARLALGEATVMELAEPFTMSQPAISKH